MRIRTLIVRANFEGMDTASIIPIKIPDEMEVNENWTLRQLFESVETKLCHKESFVGAHGIEIVRKMDK